MKNWGGKLPNKQNLFGELHATIVPQALWHHADSSCQQDTTMPVQVQNDHRLRPHVWTGNWPSFQQMIHLLGQCQSSNATTWMVGQGAQGRVQNKPFMMHDPASTDAGRIQRILAMKCTATGRLQWQREMQDFDRDEGWLMPWNAGTDKNTAQSNCNQLDLNTDLVNNVLEMISTAIQSDLLLQTILSGPNTQVNWWRMHCQTPPLKSKTWLHVADE